MARNPESRAEAKSIAARYMKAGVLPEAAKKIAWATIESRAKGSRPLSTRPLPDEPTMRDLVANPASWVTKAISANYESLEAKVKPKWLPKLAHIRAGYRGKAIVGSLNEYGCGAYGCVYETLDPGVVLKVTTDETEAEFAAKLAPDLKVPVTVHYFTVAALPDEHDKRQIFLLWREEAQKVGQIDKEAYGHKASDLIYAQHRAAQAAYDAMHYQKGPAAIHGELARWERMCGLMGDLPELKFLSHGMLEVYKKQRIFFGDIHEGNIGLCDRNGTPEWVVTDPGHVAVVDL